MNASTDTAGTERKRVSALPFLLPYAREIRRAVAGDVPGLLDLKPLPFPKRLIARRRLMRGMSSFVAAAQRSTEEERIRFARKLAVHIIRDNWHPFGSDIMLGVHWFAANRNALSSRLSLSGAVRLQKIKRKRDLEHQMQTALARWHADMQAPDVPMPVILSHGGHQLSELTTARHLVEIGIEAGNCLARRVGTTNLPHDSYWNQMRTGTRHIFALRSGGDLIAVFSIAPPDHGEIQFLIPRASVIAILKRCAPAVVAATGHPVPHIFHRWVSDDEAPHPTPRRHPPTTMRGRRDDRTGEGLRADRQPGGTARAHQGGVRPAPAGAHPYEHAGADACRARRVPQPFQRLSGTAAESATGAAMNNTEIRSLVHSVIGGKEGYPPLAFPHDPWAVNMVVTWTAVFIARSGALTEKQRALFVRKLAVYVVRRGMGNLRDLDYLYGTNWFIAWPQLLESKLTFGGAVTREALRFTFRRHEKEQRDTCAADTRAPLTEKPVVMAHDFYVLEQLVHARHLVEAGTVARNCLVRRVEGEDLPHPMYWMSVKSGRRKLFALRHRGELCLLISIVGSSVTEMRFVSPPKGVHLVLPLVADALQGTLGTLWPVHHNLPWPFPPEPPAPAIHDPGQLSFRFSEEDAHAS